MAMTSSKTLLGLAVFAALAAPASAQQQGGQGQQGSQMGQMGRMGGQMGQMGGQGQQGGRMGQQGGQMGQMGGGQMGQMGGGQMGQQGSQQGQQARVPEQYRQEQGRVVDVRPARVRGVSTPNYLVVLETQPGRRVVADIGQNRQNLNLQQGVPVTVRGKVVRVGNQRALLLADTVRIGNQTFDVDRPARMGSGRQG